MLRAARTRPRATPCSGGLARDSGKQHDALASLRRAVETLEQQQQRLGGAPEDLATFRSRYLDIYRDLVDLLLETGRPEEAFGVVESARARSLLAMLSERDLLFKDLPGSRPSPTWCTLRPGRHQ